MNENNVITLNIDSQLYPKDVVYSAFEVLSSDYIFSCMKQDNTFVITVTPRFGQKIDKQKLEAAFYDEINNQIIREQILSKTQGLREIIVGKALLGTGAFLDDHSHFDLDKYPPHENYILDEKHIADNYIGNEAEQSQ